MNNKVVIESSFEKDVMLKLFSDQKFFFTNFTPFVIVNEENENIFYIYGELYSIFSAFDVEARVRKYISSNFITYIFLLQPGLIQLSYDRLIDRSYKGVSPKGNGKITISIFQGKIEISVDYEGDREKAIVNSMIKKINKEIKNFDKIVNMERIKRHI